jgi:beta-lactamase class A
VLRQVLDEIVQAAGGRNVAVAFRDYHTDTAWSLRGAQWFHAASAMKLAVLLALHHEAAHRRIELDAWLHVRNRFTSRVDAEPFRIARERDADSVVMGQVGKMMRLRDLAERMIVASSNLATNLLIDLLGPQAIREALAELGVTGIEVLRGVEDQRAHEAGIDNRVTADGLLSLLTLLTDGGGRLRPETAQEMVDVLQRQELTGGLPLGLPPELRKMARVAHKTGEISTVAHDAGLVFLPERAPYALVVLTEWPPGSESRQQTVGKVARAVYDHLVAGAGGGA